MSVLQLFWVEQALARTGMCASVSFEVKRVVESFAARRTKITFDVAVALDVTVEQAL